MLPEMEKMVAGGVRLQNTLVSCVSNSLESVGHLQVKGEDANHHYLTSCLIMTASDLSDQVNFTKFISPNNFHSVSFT